MAAVIAPARPMVKLDGQAVPALTEGLLRLQVHETQEGLFSCEATFGPSARPSTVRTGASPRWRPSSPTASHTWKTARTWLTVLTAFPRRTRKCAWQWRSAKPSVNGHERDPSTPAGDSHLRAFLDRSGMDGDLR